MLRGLCGSTLALAFACTRAPSAPSAALAPVDVLAYLLGDASLWPRNGNHYQHQLVDLARGEVCWLKYGNPRRFECWRWDDQWIYHAVDHALDGDSEESYRFTDGRWMPRYLAASASAVAPWTLDLARNQIVWYDASCRVDPSRSRGFPYRQRAWLEPRRDSGGTLGVRDALVLEYEPYDPAAPGAATLPEHFYFGLGAGWYAWERAGFLDVFNRVDGPVILMNRAVWCDAPA